MTQRHAHLFAASFALIVFATSACQNAIDTGPDFIVEHGQQVSAIDGDLEAPAFEYHSFNEVAQYLFSATNAYPELAQLGSYGTSSGGNPLYIVALGQNASFQDDPSMVLLRKLDMQKGSTPIASFRIRVTLIASALA